MNKKSCKLKDVTKSVYVEEDSVLAILSMTEVLPMLRAYQRQVGIGKVHAALDPSPTLKEYIQQVQSVNQGKVVSICIMKKEKYYSDHKLLVKQAHRKAVTEGTKKSIDPVISRIDLEEALMDAQLHTSCVIQFAEDKSNLDDFVKAFTKAVADKSLKENRLDEAFDFLIDGAARVKVDKSGHGLLKVWKHQLQQLKNIGPDMAEAIVAQHSSPRGLYQTYKSLPTEKEAELLLEKIPVRRGGGVFGTSRCIGKEQSRRIHSILTAVDTHQVIK